MGTEPASITILVWCEVPDAILVKVQAASNYSEKRKVYKTYYYVCVYLLLKKIKFIK